MPSGLAEAYPSIKDLLQIASAMLQLESIRPIPGGKSRVSSRFAAKATACPGESAKAMIEGVRMRSFTAVIESCPETGLFVGYVPGFPGAHSQGETLDELNRNLAEVIEMLLEDGEPDLESQFVGTQTVQVA